jgi:hypothetical protein
VQGPKADEVVRALGRRPSTTTWGSPWPTGTVARSGAGPAIPANAATSWFPVGGLRGAVGRADRAMAPTTGCRAGSVPATLRTEMGSPLHGQDLSSTSRQSRPARAGRWAGRSQSSGVGGSSPRRRPVRAAVVGPARHRPRHPRQLCGDGGRPTGRRVTSDVLADLASGIALALLEPSVGLGDEASSTSVARRSPPPWSSRRSSGADRQADPVRQRVNLLAASPGRHGAATPSSRITRPAQTTTGTPEPVEMPGAGAIAARRSPWVRTVSRPSGPDRRLGLCFDAVAARVTGVSTRPSARQ